MPNVPYSFHIPFPDEGKFGVIQVVSDAEAVEVHIFGSNRELLISETLDFMEWEEAIRDKGIVITPLIQRFGAAVRIPGSDALGCLIPAPDSHHMFDSNKCIYRALISSELDMVELFFMDVLIDCLLPVGEIMYLNMAVLEEPRYRAQGADNKVLLTRLNVPHVRCPEPGKLYVTCLLQPRCARGRTTKSATAITLAVNPWDVQLASAYTGPAGNVVKHLQ